MLVESFADQRDADQQQEAECKNLHSWMSIDELTDRARRQQHHTDGDDHREDHHGNVLRHPDGRDHRVE